MPGQHVLEEAVDERFSRECQTFPSRTVALLAAGGDLPIFQRFQSLPVPAG
jgi:hypothetical protein